MRFLAPLLLVLAASPVAAAPAPGRPNVIFILADDLGYTDLGVQGSRYYETPHLDRLAAQGTRLMNHHHHQNCAPTRAALLTGQYAPRTGVYTVGGIERFDWSSRPLRPVDNVTNLPLDRVLLPQVLKGAGYATAMFGKWHLGQRGDYLPGRRGFDEAIVSNGRHFDFETEPATPYPKGQYLADFLTDRAVDFIRRHRDRPFFLYLPHFGVHAPHQAKPELIEKFRAKPAAGGHGNPVYAAMIASVDESVGRIMAVLDELGLAGDTLLVFSSDNGGLGGYTREGIRKDREDVTDNAPLRSGKGSLYEGGTRVPFLARWPGRIPAGQTRAVPTIHVDLLPTLAAAARAPLPPGQILDGENLLPLLRDAGARLARTAIFQHFPGYLGAGAGQWRTTPVSLIHEGDWKLMEFFEDGRLELYNLREDLGERVNLASAQPERARALHARLLAWRREVNAPLPTPNRGVAAPPVEKAGKTGKAGKRKAKSDGN